jgi:aspartate 1-decarboxylase
MQIQVLKSKIHNAIVTEANIDYIGSITIEEALMESVGLREEEQVHVINYRNGERLITYVIKGKRNSGEICMNGPAALKVLKGDKIIIIAYGTMSEEEASRFHAKIVFPKPDNSL